MHKYHVAIAVPTKNFKILQSANIARPICTALLGKRHSHGHRMLVGVVIMVCGVVVSKGTLPIHLEWVHGATEGVGAAIHGLGLTPFIDYLAEKFGEEV